MENDLSAQYLLALLKQTVKRSFYGEGASESEIRETIFGDSKMPAEKIDAFVGACGRVLRKAAFENWGQSELEQALDGMGGLTEDQKKVFTHIWKQESRKIHDTITNKTKWTSTLQETAWRIDVKSNSKQIDDINEPTAIVRLSLSNASDSTSEVVQCEMDKADLGKVISELDRIQTRIDAISS